MWPRRRGADRSAPGKISLGALLFVLVLILGVYLAIKFVPPYWTYLSMQDPVKEAALMLATRADEAKVRADLLRQAKEQGLAIDDNNIDIDRDGVMVVVRVAWATSVDLPGYRYTIPFRIESRVPQR